ncbi:helix-turn-helix domain-containing protein [Clostridium tagluense]|uniref:HTH cro/C1-type domain-containing protein n=1 Tax=Clostridium tagluense TaxID=360422 RepID=A0A401UTI8_9CLOT|nr:helix-turn-helix transcriptional regulator [Clostridium tagluense]GCD12872.1 hypothetical protein Ctaglu_44950 [Clostridium tagluense]
MYSLQIKKYRVRNHLTQTQLAKKTGFTQQYISSLEKNNYTTRNLSLTAIEKIAIALGVHPLDLLHETSNKKDNRIEANN